MVIFTPTMQGSGSTFLLNALRELLPPFNYYHLDTEEVILRMMDKPGIHLIHTSYWEGDHAIGLRVPFAKVEEWLAKADKTVIPVRDPWKIMITAASHGRSYETVIRGFLSMADWSREFDVFFVPVDLDGDRLELLERLVRFLGMPEKREAMEWWAREWPVINETKRGRCQPPQQAMECLISNEKVLRQFLKPLGYEWSCW
jgi:hypothetical protein